MTPEEREEQAMDMVIRLATTINAYEDVAFTSKSTNMGTYVYEKLDAIPEGIQAEVHGRALRRRARELLVHRGVALQGQVPRARGRGRARYQLGPRGLPGEARRHRGASRGERGGFFVGRSADDDDDDYADDEDGRAAKARRRAALVASAAGVQVFEGAANVPGGPFVNRFQKVFYPSPKDVGVWFGRSGGC